MNASYEILYKYMEWNGEKLVPSKQNYAEIHESTSKEEAIRSWRKRHNRFNFLLLGAKDVEELEE